jgi:hypothetical protein
MCVGAQANQVPLRADEFRDTRLQAVSQFAARALCSFIAGELNSQSDRCDGLSSAHAWQRQTRRRTLLLRAPQAL